MQARYFVLFIWQDVEPTVYGPYDDPRQRDVKALQLRADDPDDPPSGIYPADLDEAGRLDVGTYSGGFFDEAAARPEQVGLWDWLAKYPGEEGRT